MSGICILLLLSLAVGLGRSLKGPTRADRVLGLQMSTTAGIAVLLVLAEWLKQPALRDVALVMALLAAGVAAALVQILRQRPHRDARLDEKETW